MYAVEFYGPHPCGPFAGTNGEQIPLCSPGLRGRQVCGVGKLWQQILVGQPAVKELLMS